MQSIPKLIFLSAIIVLVPLSFAFAQTAEPAPVPAATCKVFSEKNLLDPNVPCIEAVRNTLNEKESEGVAMPVERYVGSSKRRRGMDESGGGHVFTVSDVGANTNLNLNDTPGMSDSIPRSGGGTDGRDGSEEPARD